MPTFLDLQNRVRQLTSGYVWNQRQFLTLTQTLTTSTTTFTVDDITSISRGLIEVGGTELMQVQSVNPAAGTVTLYGYGRGFYNTPATSWPAGTQIENNPTYPTFMIQQMINATIRNVYPDLFAVGTVDFTKNMVQFGYPMPADAEEVISVRFQIIGPSAIDPPMPHWRFDAQAPPADFTTGNFGTTGKAIYLLQDVTPGRQIHVVYKKEPAELVNPTDDFVTVTGLPVTAEDCVCFGACARLVPAFDAARLQLASIEANERAQYNQLGQASNISKYFEGLYDKYRAKEVEKLRDRYPAPVVKSY